VRPTPHRQVLLTKLNVGKHPWQTVPLVHKLHRGVIVEQAIQLVAPVS